MALAGQRNVTLRSPPQERRRADVSVRVITRGEGDDGRGCAPHPDDQFRF